MLIMVLCDWWEGLCECPLCGKRGQVQRLEWHMASHIVMLISAVFSLSLTDFKIPDF